MSTATTAAKKSAKKSTFPAKVLGERLVVQPLEAEDQSPGGILLPQQSVERPNRGEIVAIGPDVVDLNNYIHVGAQVVYLAYAGTPVRIEETDYLVIKLEDVLLVL